MPFTVEALESGNFNINLAGVDYSTDGGSTWDTTTGATTLNLSEGDTIQFKRNSLTTAQGMFSGNTAITFNVYGNIMSLLYGDSFVGETTFPNVNSVFSQLLSNSSVVYACNLILPPTTLFSGCYQQMFQICGNLLIGPELLPTTLVASCYKKMFSTCPNLSFVKCLATDISATGSLASWLYGVSATGTFVKAAGVTWPSGTSGIPDGWTVVEE